MTHAIYYPFANRTAQWFGKGNFTMPTVSKLVLHTTETVGWPGYSGGTTAPTMTINPHVEQIRQHFPLNGSARALRDPNGTEVRENRDNVAQIEICWYAEHIEDLPDWALRAVADVALFLHEEWELPLDSPSPLKWYSYPPNAAQGDEMRMSGPEYDAYKGILGHMHVSGNTHGDPGAIAIDKILQLANAATGLDPDPGPQDGDMTPQEHARLNWIYGTTIDGDGSPSVSTELNSVQEQQAIQTAILRDIRDQLASLNAKLAQ